MMSSWCFSLEPSSGHDKMFYKQKEKLTLAVLWFLYVHQTILILIPIQHQKKILKPLSIKKILPYIFVTLNGSLKKTAGCAPNRPNRPSGSKEEEDRGFNNVTVGIGSISSLDVPEEMPEAPPKKRPKKKHPCFFFGHFFAPYKHHGLI